MIDASVVEPYTWVYIAVTIPWLSSLQPVAVLLHSSLSSQVRTFISALPLSCGFLALHQSEVILFCSRRDILLRVSREMKIISILVAFMAAAVIAAPIDPPAG
jgi:hypothetical protein